jgi:hypothetical protein
MAASNEWTEWHLTPRGWEEGSSRLDSVGITHVEPPPDRVLTCQYQELLSSPYAGWEVNVTEEWRSGDEALIQQLLSQYGQCPRHL